MRAWYICHNNLALFCVILNLLHPLNGMLLNTAWPSMIIEALQLFFSISLMACFTFLFLSSPLSSANIFEISIISDRLMLFLIFFNALSPALFILPFIFLSVITFFVSNFQNSL